MASHILLTSVAILGFTVAGHEVLAQQPNSFCPPAGMVVKGKNSTGEVTRTWKGADPRDHEVCIAVSVGPGAGLVYGKIARYIYGWYPLQNFFMTPETEKNARLDLGAILSGTSEHVAFPMSNSNGHYSWSGNESWTRVGQTTIIIDAKPVKVIRLKEAFEGTGGSYYKGSWDLWYAPKWHLFVKGINNIVRGAGTGVGWFEVLSVSQP